MMYLGDYTENATLDFKWSTNDANGASITRATNGTISVYKANSTTQSTAGITDTEDFDSLTGIHHCRIDLSADAFYAAGSDYMVVLSGATIDGQSVNAVLAHFSIENRSANTTTPPTVAAIRSEIDSNSTQLAAIKAKTDNLPADPAATSDIPTTAQINAEVDTALADIHLDHLLAADYDPAAKPGLATALLNELVESDAGVSRFTQNALEQAPSGTGGATAGSTEVTDIVIDNGVNPIEGAAVWISTDEAGTNVVWSGNTNANGYPKDAAGNNPFLDPGTYYIWVQKAAYTFSNPTSKTVS